MVDKDEDLTNEAVSPEPRDLPDGPAIDWAQLVDASSTGQQLWVSLIGEEAIDSAVDFYVERASESSEVLRLALGTLQPRSATNKCFAILWSDDTDQRRELAGDLLPVMCSESDLPRIEDLINDDDPIRQHAAGFTLSKLRWSIDVDNDVISRIVRRCQTIDDDFAHSIGLMLAADVVKERSDTGSTDLDGGELLAEAEINEAFLNALTSPIAIRREDGLHYFPHQMADGFAVELQALASNDQPYQAGLAQEILDQRAT